MGESDLDHRLPETVRPVAYELRLRVDPDVDGFAGSVSIVVDVTEATDRIVLHALDLVIRSVALTDSRGESSSPAVEFDPERELIALVGNAPIPPGHAEVRIEYSGTYCRNLVGLYTSEFSRDGEQHRLAVTQCESTHARRVLPCFDEPAFKATFTVTLEVPAELTAVSNAAEVHRGPAPGDSDGFDEVSFATTIVMSSYLLAIVVGPLEVTDAPDVPGRAGPIPLRIVHPPGQSHLSRFAVEVATAALVFFEGYYDLAYPGDKVDLVAIPDFAFGAMENLGCVTFREVLLLIDPASATPMEMQRVADVINHELAHMWFGDLVTMRWWNGIWLNEAFATFMEISASDSFRPEWEVWTTFGLARSAAFDTDALDSTRPIEFEVRTASESEAMFDIITYEKGASVLRMLEQYLGAEAFRDGIRRYLRTHAHANTDTGDLWVALEESTGEPVRQVAESWIFRGGHPLVSVSSDPGSDVVELTQRRAAYRRASGAEASEEPFPVPLRVVAQDAEGSETTHRFILSDDTTLELATAPALLRVNPGGDGFFRTLLPRAARRALLERVDCALERFVVLDDTWFAVLAGHSGPAEILDTIAASAEYEESDPSVWRRVSSVLSELERLLSPAQRSELSEFTIGTLAAVLGRFPPLESTGRNAEVAATVLGILGRIGEEPRARELAESVFENQVSQIDAAVVAAALEVVAREPTPEQYTEIERRWREAENPQDEQRHLAALVATGDPEQFARGLSLCATEVRSQDAPYTLRRALANRAREADAWDFVVDNFATLLKRLPSGALPRMFEGIRGFTDEWTALAVERFLADHPLPTGSRQVDQHVERMHASVAAATRLRSLPAEFWSDP